MFSLATLFIFSVLFCDRSYASLFPKRMQASRIGHVSILKESNVVISSASMKDEKLKHQLSIRGGSTDTSDPNTNTSDFAGNEASNRSDGSEKGKFFRLDILYPIVRSALSTVVTDSDVLHVMSRIFSFVAWMYLLLSALGTWGIDTKPVVSLLGIGGLTVGFSARDLLADSYAGLFLLFSRPFQRGDVITINGMKGKVLSVDMRYVRLYSVAEKSEILIPVSTVHRSEIKIDRSGIY